MPYVFPTIRLFTLISDQEKRIDLFDKIIRITVIVIFFAAIAVTALLSDFQGGKVSEAQNRVLASFPDAKESDMTFDKFTEEFENWSNDNIGLHDIYSRLYTKFNVLLNISSTERVYIGKNGFYFYTAANNVKIATGEHIISDEKLREIASVQQEISDYYKKNGKKYYLVLVPGKPSVYPENLKGGHYEITETTVDRIEKYLVQNTDVNVINVKKALIDCKEQGELAFRKTDTHWTNPGAYAAYNAIMDRLISDGAASYKADFSPEFTNAVYAEGDLSKMIGVGALPPECLYTADWDNNWEYDNSSSKYYELEQELDLLSSMHNIEITRNEQRYTNPSAAVNPLTLQIYGDSLYLDFQQINQFFAENFETVQYLRVRSVCQELDDITDPDIVIFSTFERLSESVLCNPPLLLEDSSALDSLDEIPVDKADMWIGTKGLYITSSDSSKCSINDLDMTFNKDSDSYDLSGWAFDYNQRSDLDNVFLFADDIPLPLSYGMDGTDVGEHFGFDNVKNCRFKLTLKKDFLMDNNIKQIKFIMTSSDGVHKYEPIIYNVNFD